MLSAASLVLVGHAAYLLATTGSKWGRSDIVWQSGYSFCAFLFVLEAVVGSYTLVAACLPTPSRVSWARSILGCFHLGLAALYVIVGAATRYFEALAVALTGDPQARMDVHQLGWYVTHFMLPSSGFLLCGLLAFWLGKRYISKDHAPPDLEVAVNPSEKIWTLSLTCLVLFALFTQLGVNQVHFVVTNNFQASVDDFNKAAADYVQKTQFLIPRCVIPNTEDRTFDLSTQYIVMYLPQDPSSQEPEKRFRLPTYASVGGLPKIFKNYANISSYLTQTDTVKQFIINTNTFKLTPLQHVDLTKGSGPRHLALLPISHKLHKTRAYLVNEHVNTVTPLSFDAAGGVVLPKPDLTVTSLPAGFTDKAHASAIRVSPDGRFLYVGNRCALPGKSSIAVFAIDPNTGNLKFVNAVGGADLINWPRDMNFNASGRLFAVANQNSKNVTLFNVDQNTGALSKVLVQPLDEETTFVGFEELGK